jgi:hypothetical protein
MKIKIKIILQLLVVLVVFSSCKCKDISNTPEKIITKGTEKDMIVEKSYNSIKTMLLVTSFKNDLSARKLIYYKVIDVADDKIIQQGSFEGTKLVWFTNNKLKGFKHIGMIKNNDDASLLNEDKNKENNFIIIDIK